MIATRVLIVCLGFVLIGLSGCIGVPKWHSGPEPLKHGVMGAVRSGDAVIIYGTVYPIAAYTNYGVFVHRCVDDKGRPLAFRGATHWWAKQIYFALNFAPVSSDAELLSINVDFMGRGTPSVQRIEKTLRIQEQGSVVFPGNPFLEINP